MKASHIRTKTSHQSITEMNQELINETETALLIIDVQQRLIAKIANKINITKKIVTLIKALKALKINVFHTEQNPKGLGKTVDDIRIEINSSAYSKMSFSCYECKELFSELKEKQIRNLIVCGVESHICILQSAIELLNKGFNVFIIVLSIPY